MDANSDASIPNQLEKNKPSNFDSSNKGVIKRQRPPSPAPYALHVKEEVVAKGKLSSSMHNNSTTSLTSLNSQSSLKAPYAQPILDASKLQGVKRNTNSVDERIASVRDRRLQKQQVHDNFVSVRRAKEEAAHVKWEQTQEEKRKKAEEQKERDSSHRKKVEARKNKQLQEDMKRAESIVARTEQQANVVLRQKRAASADRTKRWSWGAGGMSGGGGGMPLATRVESAPSPFHYYDPTKVTKQLPTERHRRRPLSMDVSEYVGSGKLYGDERYNQSSPAVGNIGQRNTSISDDKFSKSPLVVSTAHMKFASGLRSYDTSPAPANKKVQSPALPRHRRARSTDIRVISHSKDKQTSQDPLEKPQTMPTKRGRSPGVRKSASLKGTSTSPQLTEPLPVSSRLLAPTRASIARSMNRDFDELSNASSTASTPLRSRSIDKKRPTSAKSDSSTASSTMSSRVQQNTKPSSKPGTTTRGVSPSPRVKPRPPSPVVRSKSPATVRQGESPKLKSSMSNEPLASKRPPSPGRKKTPIRDFSLPLKSSPPTIKQSLTPTSAINRTKKNSPSSGSSPSNSLAAKMKKTKMSSQSVKVSAKTPVKERLNLSNKTFKVASPENDEVEIKLFAKDPVSPPHLVDESVQLPPAPSLSSEVGIATGGEQIEEVFQSTPPASSDVLAVDKLGSASQDEVSSAVQSLVDVTRTTDDVTVTENIGNEASSRETDAVVIAVAKNAIEQAQSELRNEMEKEDAPAIGPQEIPDEKSANDDVMLKPDVIDEAREAQSLQAEIQQVDDQPAQAPQLNETFILDQPVSLTPEKTSTSPKAPSSPAPEEPAISTPEKPTASASEKNSAPVPEKATAPEETKKKEKKITAEEQAYKDAIAAKRREMKEKREREERERQERLRIEAEEQARREEDARKMAEEARIEHERMLEEEKLKKEEEERKKKEAEELAKKHEDFLREQRERVEQKAREEAEKQRQDRKLAAQKQDEERSERRKRLQMIMRRTRGGDSPTTDAEKTATPGDQSPANVTPAGGSSPYNSTTPVRVASPVTIEKKAGDKPPEINSSIEEKLQPEVNSDQVEVIHLNNPHPDNQLKVNGNSHQPLVAFEDPLNASSGNNDLFNASNFPPTNNPSNNFNVNGSNDDPFQLRQTGDFNHSVSPPNDSVATGDLLGL